MEKQLLENESSKCRKRKITDSSMVTDLSLLDTNALFAILLAALFNNSQTLIKKCLTKLRFSLLSQSQPTLPLPVLSLLPVLLKSKCGRIARFSAEFVGAASLSSLEINEQIAMDGEIIKGLEYILRNYSKRSVLMAACNAVLDLSTTPVGRLRLLEFSALESLIFTNLLLQVLVMKDMSALSVQD